MTWGIIYRLHKSMQYKWQRQCDAVDEVCATNGYNKTGLLSRTFHHNYNKVIASVIHQINNPN